MVDLQVRMSAQGMKKIKKINNAKNRKTLDIVIIID